jgi:hypothetical protein
VINPPARRVLRLSISLFLPCRIYTYLPTRALVFQRDANQLTTLIVYESFVSLEKNGLHFVYVCPPGRWIIIIITISATLLYTVCSSHGRFCAFDV